MRLPVIKHIVQFIENNDQDYVTETIETLENLIECEQLKDEELDVIGELLSNFYGAIEVDELIKQGTPQKEALNKNNGGIEGVTYPILADSNRNLARTLGILDSREIYDETADAYLLEGDDVTFRATYLIDETGKVFHESINDMPLGRNVKEYLRLVDAYTHVQQHGEVCPANWEEGKDAMNANRNGVASYLASH